MTLKNSQKKKDWKQYFGYSTDKHRNIVWLIYIWILSTQKLFVILAFLEEMWVVKFIQRYFIRFLWVCAIFYAISVNSNTINENWLIAFDVK